MKAAILSIGNEVLQGYVINTNAAFLAKQLGDRGFTVHCHKVLPDEREALLTGIEQLFTEVDLIVATGGLGPTSDDTTRESAAFWYGTRCFFSNDRVAQLKDRFGEITSLKDQSTIIEGATLLDNKLGSAAGFFLEKEGKRLALLPGVPKEMEGMWKEALSPILKPLTNTPFIAEGISFSDIFESAIDPFLRQQEEKFPTLKFGIYPSYGVVNVRIRGPESEAQKLQVVKEAFEKEFAPYLFFAPSGQIDEAIHILMRKKKITLSLAESCSGGIATSKLTRWPGASDYFLGSFIAYSNSMKENVLGVSESTLEEFGAVSEETAREMAVGALKLTGSDFAGAITGIAGPTGGTFTKPVGRVCFAIASKNGGEISVFTKDFFGSRIMVMEKSANALLSALHKKIVHL